MATYKCKGIILKRTNLGEADRILTILTSDRGKIRVVAKGVRKTLSKLAGNCELFMNGNFMFAEGRSLDILTSAEMKESYQDLRKDLKSTQSAFYMAEIIEKRLPDDEPHEEIYNLFAECLEELNKKNDSLVLSFFEINLLSDTGFEPELYKCLNCGEKITPEGNFFSVENGGLSCPTCKADLEISDETIKALRLILKHRLKNILKIKLNKKTEVELKKIIKHYFKNIHQEILKSESFI